VSRSGPVTALAAGLGALQLPLAFLAALAPCGWGLGLYSVAGVVVATVATCLPLWLRAGGTPNRRFGLAGMLAMLAGILWWIGLEWADLGLVCPGAAAVA
jgi:hypothetical protein